MKNIHVLPTDKPSRLSILNSGKLNFGAEAMSSSNSKLQHIYITSDEEIKEGDWFIMSGFILRKCDYVDNYMIIDTTQGKHFFSVCKKIILTTDQDLIKDGIQAIDDIFLEWFVENPSCEEVEIELFPKFSNNLYGIIIPQEEPKEILCGKANKFYRCITCDAPCGSEGHYIEVIEDPKQETLEEAAERLYPISKGGSMWMPSADDCNKANKQEGFIEGAKSEAARDYWFEQFKKKGGDK